MRGPEAQNPKPASPRAYNRKYSAELLAFPDG